MSFYQKVYSYEFNSLNYIKENKFYFDSTTVTMSSGFGLCSCIHFVILKIPYKWKTFKRLLEKCITTKLGWKVNLTQQISTKLHIGSGFIPLGILLGFCTTVCNESLDSSWTLCCKLLFFWNKVQLWTSFYNIYSVLII